MASTYYADPADTPPIIVTSDQETVNIKKYQKKWVVYSKLPEVPSTSKKVELYESSRSSAYKDNPDYTNRVIYVLTRPRGKPIKRHVYFRAGFSDPNSTMHY